MEDAGNGQANFDDEDPDMEGWSDMDGSSDEDKGSDENVDYLAMDGVEEASFDSDGVASVSIDDDDVDADAFMDGGVSDDNSDGVDEVVYSSRGHGQYFEGGNHGSSDDDEDDDDDDDDDGFPAALLVDEGSDMDDEGNEGKRESPDKKEKYLEGFADAADYQHLIGQGWEDRKRSKSHSLDGNEDDDAAWNASKEPAQDKKSSSESRSQRRRKRRKGN